MVQLIVLLCFSLWAVVQNVWYWNYLPERVAIHFGADGQPNDWLDRNGATVMMIAIQVALPWLLVGIAQSIRYMPVSLINIPNREYWLTGERRDASLQYVRNLVTSIAILESIFVSLLSHLAFTANRTGQPLNITLFAIVLLAFMAATLVLVVKLLKRFTLPKNAVAQP